MQAELTPDIGRRIKNRDHQAFHTLYIKTFDTMRKYAYRYVYDWEEAADIVQQAYLSLWLNIDRYSDDTDIITYLSAIVHNLCSNYLRHLDVIDSNHDKMVEATLFSRLQDYCEVNPDIKRRLDKALEKLPPQGRRILMEHIVNGKKVNEIASEMDISQSTVKTHLKRALRLLRQNMLLILLFMPTADM